MKGFILYPSYAIENDKAYVLLYGRLENGKSFLTRNYARPYFYIESSKLKKAKKLEKFDYEETNFKNFNGELLTKVIIDLPRDIPSLRQKLEKENIECYEADIRFAYRFMIDNDLQGTIDISGKSEKHEYVDFFFNEPELKPSSYIPKLKTLSIDIETSRDSKKLYSIAMYSKNYEKTFIVHSKSLNGTFTGDEKAVLEEFKKEFLVFDPDIITGWSIIDFDLDYLNRKFSENKIPFTLGRSSEKCKLSIETNFFKTSKADFPGRQVLDSLSLIRDPYLKDSPYIRSKKFENYRLETVAKEILGKSKLIDNTKDKGEEIDRLYREDKKDLLKYNLNDAVLTYEILEETKLIDLLIERSILTGMPLDRVNASIASLDSLYIREARKRKVVVPSSKFTEKKHPITGGYVMQSKPGIYENILVFDFKSLYPSVMMTFNIDPSSYLEKKEKNCIETPNKAYFKNTEGILPSILEKLMEARAKAKKEKRELSSQAIKITMNSMFGSMASPASRFFNMKIANSITTFGQYLIKSTAEKIQEEGYEVIYSDSVGKDSEVIIKDKNEIKFTKIKDLFREVNKKSVSGKDYYFPNNLLVLTLDSKGKSAFKPVEYVMRHKTNKKIYRMWFTNSLFIDATEDHSLIGYLNANNGPLLKPMQRLSQVRPTEIGYSKIKSIVTLKKIPRSHIKRRSYPKEMYLFMGYFIGDGSFMRNKSHQKSNKDYYIRLSTGIDTNEILEEMIEPLKKEGYIKNYWFSRARKGDMVFNGLRLVKIILEELRDKEGKKKIPEWLFEESEGNISAFLNGLFSADGTVIIRHKKPIIRLCNTDKDIVENTRKLLYFIGISNSYFRENKPNKYKGKISNTYSMHIIIKDLVSFKEKVGFIIKKKQERLDLIKKPRYKKNFHNLDFDLSKVMKVEKIQYSDYVYDIEVGEEHRFFANETLVHNTDSIFLNPKVESSQKAEKIGKETEEKLNSFYKKYIKEKYNRDSKLELEFEKNYTRFLMPKIRGGEKGAKKRYAGLLIDSNKEKIDIVGMEFARSDWTGLSKKFQLEMLDRIFHKKEVSDFIKKFVEDLKTGKYDDLLVYKKSLRKGIGGYQVESQHLKAAKKLKTITSNLIEYVITTDGPEPIQNQKHKIDYGHYIDKQIKPIADSVLCFYNTSFDELLSNQYSLFDFKN